MGSLTSKRRHQDDQGMMGSPTSKRRKRFFLQPLHPLFSPLTKPCVQHNIFSSSSYESIFILLFISLHFSSFSTPNTNLCMTHPHEKLPRAVLFYRAAPPQKAAPRLLFPHFSLLFSSHPFFPVHHQGLPPPKPQFEAPAIGRKGRED